MVPVPRFPHHCRYSAPSSGETLISQMPVRLERHAEHWYDFHNPVDHDHRRWKFAGWVGIMAAGRELRPDDTKVSQTFRSLGSAGSITAIPTALATSPI